MERGSSILVSHLEVQEVSTSARLLAYIATTFKGLVAQEKLGSIIKFLAFGYILVNWHSNT